MRGCGSSQTRLRNLSIRSSTSMSTCGPFAVGASGHVMWAATTSASEPREVRWSERLDRLKGHLLNVAAVPDRCDFYMGGIVTNGSLKLAISTDGKAPILAKRMREWLEDVLPEDVESNLDELQALRRELKGDFAQKQATLRALTRHFRDQRAS